MLLFADDIIIFANAAVDMQLSLNILNTYCKKMKLNVNKVKTKNIVFRKGGILPRDLKLYIDNSIIEIISKFLFLGIVFTRFVK